LLDQAVNESIDSLTLFTLPVLQNQKNFAIVFNEELLEQVQKNFDFHALFNISVHLCPVREVKRIGLNLSLCYSCFATNNLKQRRFKPWPIVTHSFILC